MVEELEVEIYKSSIPIINYCKVCDGVAIKRGGNTPYIDGAVYCDC